MKPPQRPQTRRTGTETRSGSKISPDPRVAPKRGKYGVRLDPAGVAARTVNGIVFASKAEADRYQQLVVAERAGEIKCLEIQPAWPLAVEGTKVATYRADFGYLDMATRRVVVEDVKGVATPVYKLKKRLMLAIYGIEIREIR